jgi:hypothetical protein
MKGRLVVACLFLACLVVIVLENTAVAQSPPARSFDWTEKHDLKRWLQENELTLRRGDACTLTYWWLSEEDPNGPRSARHPLITFAILPADEETTKIILDQRSGLDVRVGVRYLPGDSKSSNLLQLALAFEGSASGVFDEVDRAQAEALRYPGWRSLTFVKPISVDHVQYTFSLNCHNGSEHLAMWKDMLSQPNAKGPRGS